VSFGDCRIVRMVTHPVIGAISNMLWSFNSSSQGYIESVPQLQVCLMSSIHCHCCVQGCKCTTSAYLVFCDGRFFVIWCSQFAAAAVAATSTCPITLGACTCSQLNWCEDISLKCIYIYRYLVKHHIADLIEAVAAGQDLCRAALLFS